MHLLRKINKKKKEIEDENKKENLFLNTLFTLLTVYFRTSAVTFQD